MRARSSLVPFVVFLLGLDVAVVFALGMKGPVITSEPAPAGDSAEPTSGASPSDVAHSQAQDADWALCLTRFDGKPVTPTSVAITYLDASLDDDITPSVVRSWFGQLDGMIVDVYKLEHENGRRRISFEITRSKWPEWDRVASGQSGETVCSLVRAALVAAKIGRPRSDDSQASTSTATAPAAAQLAPSRHQFEFIYARRPGLYRTIEWVGTLEHALEHDTFAALGAWLNAGDTP